MSRTLINYCSSIKLTALHHKKFITLFAIAAITVMATLFTENASAQIFAGYSLSSGFSGSMTNMAGATPVMTGGHFHITSGVMDLPFDFYYRGTRYQQFSVNSGGFIGFGTTSVSSTLGVVGGSTVPQFTALGSADQALSSSSVTPGSISYKVTGSAPSRVMTIQFSNMVLNYATATTTNSDASYEVRLYEGSGAIEAVYGSMAVNGLTTSASFYIGGSSGTTSLAAMTVNSNTDVLNTGSVYAHSFTAGQPISTLTSSSDGSRKTYTLTPAAANAPSGLSAGSITKTGMTLNWTDNSTDETGFAVYYSPDAGTNYYHYSTTAANITSLAVTGLKPGTTYYWRIYAVKDALSSASSVNATTTNANTVTSAATGNWSLTSTWVGGVVPTSSDNVIIADGHTVTINNTSAVCNNLTVGGGTSGILTYPSAVTGELYVYGNLVVNTGATFTAGTGSLNTHGLFLGSSATSLTSNNLTVDGTLDFNTTAFAKVTFQGRLDATLSGSGSTADFYSIEVNKGDSRIPMLDVTRIITIATPASSAKYITITNGTFRLSSASSLTPYNNAQTICEIAGRLWINNASALIQGTSPGTSAGNGNVTFRGELRIDAGTFSYGNGSNAASFGVEGDLVMNGGSFIMFGFFQFLSGSNCSFTMTGGNIYIDPQAAASVVSTNSLFWFNSNVNVSMSGGNIYFIDPHNAAGGLAWRGSGTSGRYSITGGNIYFGDGTSTTGGGTFSATSGFGIFSSNKLPNIIINNRTDVANSRMVRLASDVDALSVSVMTNGYLFLGDNATGYSLGVTSSLQNNGTIGGTQPSGSASIGKLLFKKSGANQTLSGSGAWVNIPYLGIDNNGYTLTMSNSNTMKVNMLNHVSGTLNPGSNLTIGNASPAGNELPQLTWGSDEALYPPPSCTSFPTLDETEGLRSYTYGGATTGITMGAMGEASSGTFDLHSIYVRNTVGLSIPNTISPVVKTELGLASNAKIVTNGGTLTLGASSTSGTLTYAAGSVIEGKLKRWVMNTATSYDFPVGLTANRRSVQINFTSAPSASGTLTAEWVSTAGGSAGLPITEGSIIVDHTASDGYWSIISGDGFSGGTYTGTFMPTGISGVTDNTKLVLLKRANSSSSWALDGTHIATSGSNASPLMQRSGLSGFGDFGIGNESTIPLPLRMLNLDARIDDSKHSVLSWTVIGEKGVKEYIVERSKDGSSFGSIGTVLVSASATYGFADMQPLSGNNYYRLRIVEGQTFGYSKVVVLHYMVSEDLSVFPDPAKSELNLSYLATEEGSAQLSITDQLGRIVYSKQVSVRAGVNTMRVSTNTYQPGLYFLNVSGRVVRFGVEP
jgi:hypothetical protein